MFHIDIRTVTVDGTVVPHAGAVLSVGLTVGLNCLTMYALYRIVNRLRQRYVGSVRPVTLNVIRTCFTMLTVCGIYRVYSRA